MSREKSGKAKNSKTAPTRTAKEKKLAKAEKRRTKKDE
jgi:hypothetical protein